MLKTAASPEEKQITFTMSKKIFPNHPVQRKLIRRETFITQNEKEKKANTI